MATVSPSTLNRSWNFFLVSNLLVNSLPIWYLTIRRYFVYSQAAYLFSIYVSHFLWFIHSVFLILKAELNIHKWLNKHPRHQASTFLSLKLLRSFVQSSSQECNSNSFQDLACRKPLKYEWGETRSGRGVLWLL